MSACRVVLIIPLLLALAACQNLSDRSLPDACYQPPESGMCRAAFQRYYYDQNSKTCKAFLWGGCKGSVPFETLKECQQTCQAPDTPTSNPLEKANP